MSDGDTYRRAAAACLEIANTTNNPDVRTGLLLLAGNFLDQATRIEADDRLKLLPNGAPVPA
jgi:hypothetical protein